MEKNTKLTETVESFVYPEVCVESFCDDEIQTSDVLNEEDTIRILKSFGIAV